LTLNKLFLVADRIGRGTAWVDALSRGSGVGSDHQAIHHSVIGKEVWKLWQSSLGRRSG
jgi:hypothetical protein